MAQSRETLCSGGAWVRRRSPSGRWVAGIFGWFTTMRKDFLKKKGILIAQS